MCLFLFFPLIFFHILKDIGVCMFYFALSKPNTSISVPFITHQWPGLKALIYTIWPFHSLNIETIRIFLRMNLCKSHTILWRKLVLGCSSSHHHHRKLPLIPDGFRLWSIKLAPQKSHYFFCKIIFSVEKIRVFFVVLFCFRKRKIKRDSLHNLWVFSALQIILSSLKCIRN